jgi:hypothetical protein
MEKTFQEIINTIKEGETWVNKDTHRRLKSVECLYGNVTFYLDDFYKSFGVKLNDEFVLEKEKFSFEKAMEALKRGDIIESCHSRTKYAMSPRENEPVNYFDTVLEDWRPSLGMFTHQEIFGEWYIL